MADIFTGLLNNRIRQMITVKKLQEALENFHPDDQVNLVKINGNPNDYNDNYAIAGLEKDSEGIIVWVRETSNIESKSL